MSVMSRSSSSSSVARSGGIAPSRQLPPGQQALRDLNTKVILPLRSHPWLSYTAIKLWHSNHREGAAFKAKSGFLPISISLLIQGILTLCFWDSYNVLVCRLWSSFASNADSEAHAQRWQKHGEDFLVNDLRQRARKVSCPVEKELVHHSSWAAQENHTRMIRIYISNVTLWECCILCTVSPSSSVPSWNTHPQSQESF